MGVEGASGGKFRSVLVSVTPVKSVSPELMSFVQFRANIEQREVDPDDDVAIFNVHGTGSHFVIFLDAGKTEQDLEEEVVPYNVIISRVDWQRLLQELEKKRMYAEATDDA